MKIIHISDVYGDLDNLEVAVNFAKEGGADVLACTGDLLGECLSQDEVKSMQDSFGLLKRSIKTDGRAPFSTVLTHIVGDSRVPDAIRQNAQIYQQLEQKFKALADKQYGGSCSLVKDFPGEFLVVCGNRDCLKFADHFGKFRADANTVKLGSGETRTTFAGYGGSSETPSIIPPTQLTNFSERGLFTKLSENDPDVALTHVPPYGLQDVVEQGGKKSNVGSFALRCYIIEQTPALVLCGHIHEGRGHSTFGNGDVFTTIVNAGNLGRYGNSPGGNFAQIELGKKNYVSKVSHFKIQNREVFEVE